MKVIFLDVDGLLNNANYTKKCYRKNGHKPMSMYCVPFDPYNLKNLAKIVRKTGANIVLTSTWRLDKEHMAVLRARLAEYGLKIYDQTSNFGMNRGAEISEWLKEHLKGKKSFVIIDDDTFDILPFFDRKYIIQTNAKYGLTFGDRIKAINKLKGVE